MTLISLTSLMAAAISTLVYLAAWILSSRSMMDREKSSAFECGFDSKNSARIPFSMRFFLLAIIFIVFDIEIVLLMPIPTIMMSAHVPLILLMTLMFLAILLFGLMYEWAEGSLNWST